MISYPNRIQLAQTPTPLQLLQRLSDDLGGPRIWIKRDDYTGSATTGNKVRKLEFLLADALAQGCDTVITSGGVQSNHCRATAILCAQLGLKCHLILRADRDDAPIGNLLLDQLVGATISHFSVRDYTANLGSIFAELVAEYAEQGHKAYCIPTGGSSGTGVWGYIRCMEEMQSDFQQQGIAPGAIVHATGSAGTQAGLTAGAKLLRIDTEIWGFAVCDDCQYFVDKVHDDLRQWQQRYMEDIDTSTFPVNVLDNYIGPGYGVAGDEVFASLQYLARLEGVILDPVYTGKAFHGMVEEIKRGRWSDVDDIVFIHTGGIFGLLAQPQQLPCLSKI